LAKQPPDHRQNPWPDFDFSRTPRTIRSILLEEGQGISEKTNGKITFEVETRAEARGGFVHDCFLVARTINFKDGNGDVVSIDRAEKLIASPFRARKRTASLSCSFVRDGEIPCRERKTRHGDSSGERGFLNDRARYGASRSESAWRPSPA
jgi:hypothetical protein